MLNKLTNKAKYIEKKRNLVAVVMDNSSSMCNIAVPASNMLRSVFADLANVPADQETLVSYYLFDDVVKTKLVNVLPRGVHVPAYSPSGNTALRDGICTAIENMQNHPWYNNPNTSCLVIVITDGEENQSRIYTDAEAKSEIRSLQASGRWTFVAHVPPAYPSTWSLSAKQRMMQDYNIPAGNIREWETTAKGVQEVTVANTRGTSAYYGARGQGQSQISTFFVQTDLSKLTTTAAARKLTDLSHNFKVYTVDKEDQVREFTERHTNRAYIIGQSYYELTKPETVQPNKRILIQHMNGGPIYGGIEARQELKLPTDGISNAQVRPGNHGEWKVFVESTSINRKLVRGTKLLVDVYMVQGMKPTWDHTVLDTKAVTPTTNATQTKKNKLRAKLVGKRTSTIQPRQANGRFARKV
jgi:hypothetical protein